MDSQQLTQVDIQELLTERDDCVPSILSAVTKEHHAPKVLNSIKLCTKYLPTYDVSNVERELLRHIVPVIKNCLQKVYTDNFLLSDTAADDLVLTILKDNLQVVLGFIETLRTILKFLSGFNEINLNDLSNVPTDLARVILLTLEHCKNSTDGYKSDFNVELVEIFRVTQEVHLLFLRLFESYIVIDAGGAAVEVLAEVLDITCCMGEALSEMNVKSMTDNWKSYTAISQKFSDLLCERIDLKTPIRCLTSEIRRNLTSVENLDENDKTVVPQVVKITSFLIKVALKIYDIFWTCLEKYSGEVVHFCSTIYSFPADRFRAQQYPTDIVDLVQTSLFSTCIEPFLRRLTNDAALPKILSPNSFDVCDCAFGTLNFLNSVLKLLVLNDEKFCNFSVDALINCVFNAAKLCFVEFHWPSGSLEVFDNLVVNITAVTIVYDECYSLIERILLENLLQEDVWSALLAVEVWTLLLSNSSSELRLETLINLVKIHKELEFGVYTARVEEVYMKYLMQRAFRMLPVQVKEEFVPRVNPSRNVQSWKMMQLRGFPVKHRLLVEAVAMATIDKIDMVGKAGFGLKDLVFITENLDVLSSANFYELGRNPDKLANASLKLWEFNLSESLASNNLFKHFLGVLRKITSTLMTQLSNKQLVTVLTQLKALASDESYALLICDVLEALSKKPQEYSQDAFKISALITSVLYPSLLCSKNAVVKQCTLEVVSSFATHQKLDFVKSLMQVVKDVQLKEEISRFLQKHVVAVDFDRQYLVLLGTLRFHHECIAWKRDACVRRPSLKRLGDDACATAKERVVKIFKPAPAEVETNVGTVRNEDDKTEQVGEVINSIKGEVKCLLKVLKTEKLSRKNASDIRLVANQLLSLL